MKIAHLVVALACAAALSAQAAPTVIGSFSAPTSVSVASGTLNAGDSIADSYTFDLTGDFDAVLRLSQTFAASSGAIGSFAATLTGGTLASPVDFVLTPHANDQVLDLSATLGAGSYTIDVSGLVNKTPTTYGVQLALGAVPEPATFAVLGVGLALGGALSLRRKNG